MKIYCITHKPIKAINSLNLIPFGVGQNTFPKLLDRKYWEKHSL